MDDLIWCFIVIIFVLINMVGIIIYLLIRLYKSEDKITRFRAYAKRTYIILPEVVDVILLGPRLAGKTSIVKLWTHPWAQINRYEATEAWTVYETDIYQSDMQTFKDMLYGITRSFVRTVRIRVHDYPGEEEYGLQAIQHLGKMQEKAVLLFVFQVGFDNLQVQHGPENAAYFNQEFVEQLHGHVHTTDCVARAIVVFNKRDTLPPEWDNSKAEKELRMANNDAIRNIERIFGGPPEFQLVSAETNEGMIELLGKVGRTALDSQEEQQSFEEILQEKYERFLGHNP